MEKYVVTKKFGRNGLWSVEIIFAHKFGSLNWSTNLSKCGFSLMISISKTGILNLNNYSLLTQIGQSAILLSCNFLLVKQVQYIPSTRTHSIIICHNLSQYVTNRRKLSQTVTICLKLSQTVTNCHNLSQWLSLKEIRCHLLMSIILPTLPY